MKQLPGLDDIEKIAVPELGIAEEAMGAAEGGGKGNDFNKEYEKAFGRGRGGGGGMPHIEWTKILLILAVVGIIIIVVFWFFSVGGGQASAGLGTRVGMGIGAIFDSYAIKSFMNTLSNPFGIQPTSGQYEEVQSTQPKTPPPNQAFSVEIRGATDTVLLDQKALMFIVKVNNLGSSKISKMDISLDLLPPYSGCLVFDSNGDGIFESGKAEITDIAPFSSKEKVFSGGKIDGECVADKLGGSKLKPKIPVGNMFAYAKAITYYPTASRLAVERIKEDYGILLVRNDVLRQQKTGAIYRSGSALTIDMDIGDQPIFDSVTEAGLLMRWQNLGKGKMPVGMKPFLFIVTPDKFGKCLPTGIESLWTIIADGERITYKLGSWFGGAELEGSESDLFWCDVSGASGVASPSITYDEEGELIYECPIGAYYDNGECKTMVNCVLCDKHLSEHWCDPNKDVYKQIEEYAPHAKPIFDWMCSLVDKGYHVCGTSTLTEEFNVFSCSLKLPGPIKTNENRVTEYITAAAIYPYEVKSPSLGIKAYCIESQTDICESS